MNVNGNGNGNGGGFDDPLSFLHRNSGHGGSGGVLNEDYIEYRIYYNVEDVDLSDDVAKQAVLRAYLVACNAFLEPLIRDYNWQRDQFSLSIRGKNSQHEHPLCLHGRTRVGDNMDDEWFIIYLLRSLSSAFPKLMCIAASDCDGELLLIEAANMLPEWLSPDVSEHRVFLRCGNVHIVPMSPDSPGDIGYWPHAIGSGGLTETVGVAAVMNESLNTQASKDIQDIIHDRLVIYPEMAVLNTHHTLCRVPRLVAAVITRAPRLVAAATEAFYTRDQIDMRACRVMKNFPPSEFVTTRVAFSRCQYAQLLQQRFTSPKSFGIVPSVNEPARRKAHDLGAKLACGFEILAARGSHADTIITSDTKTTRLNSPIARHAWDIFLTQLCSIGYFGEEIEGSKRYQDLMRMARQSFDENDNDKDLRDRHNPVAMLLKELHFLLTNPSMEESHYNTAVLLAEKGEDSDAWLDVSPEDLEADLKKKQKNFDCIVDLLDDNIMADDNDKDDDSDDDDDHVKDNIGNDQEVLKDEGAMLYPMLSRVKDFVSSMASHEGAEVNGNLSDSSDNDENELNFSMQEFINAMQGVLADGDHLSTSQQRPYINEKCGKQTFVQTVEMDAMDRELVNTDIGNSFSRIETNNDEIKSDALAPVDVDLELVKNMLEAYSAEGGVAGPASTLLSSLGLSLPDNYDETNVCL